MRRVSFVLLMLFAGFVVLAGVGVLLWGGVVAGFVSADGSTPGDVPGFVLVVLGMCLMAGGGKLVGFASRAAGLDL